MRNSRLRYRRTAGVPQALPAGRERGRSAELLLPAAAQVPAEVPQALPTGRERGRSAELLLPAAAQAGLTLIEILIAMALLAFVSIAIYQATTRSYEVNARLGAESSDYTAILLSMQAVEADLSQIYSPQVGNIPPKADDKIEAFWSAPVRADGLRRSRLTGSGEKVTFVTNGNRRVEEDAPQSDFLKVTWEVERNNAGTFTLYRTTDWDAFHYEEGSAKKPERVPLLENLSSAKFTYYRKANKTWEDKWDSEGIYVKEETRFPDLISLKIEVPDPTNNANQQSWEMIVKPNLALNYKDKKTLEAEKQRLEP